MNPLFHTEFSISDSLKNVRKSVLIYETIIHNDLAMDYFNYAKILKKTGEEEKELQYLQKSKEIYLYNENLEEVERIEEVIREILENNENKY